MSIASRRLQRVIHLPVILRRGMVGAAHSKYYRNQTDGSINATTTDLDTWTRLESDVGPIAARRSYEIYGDPLPASFAASAASIDAGKRVSVWSAGPPIAQVIDGTYDAAINQFLESIPTNHTMYVTLYHEVDAKIRLYQQGTTNPAGSNTTAQFKQAFIRFANLVHAKQSTTHPLLKTYICLTNFIFIDRTPTFTADDLWPGAGYCDVWAGDTYGTANFDPMSSIISNHETYARGKGIDWAVGETASQEDPNNANRKAVFLQSIHQYLDATPQCHFICYFSRANIPTSSSTDTGYIETSDISRTAYAQIAALNNIPPGTTV